MLTLTYAPGSIWRPGDVKRLLKSVREWARVRAVTIPYVWKAELTRAGAPHYHVLFWLPKGITLPKPDKRGWWPHGHTRIEWAKRAVSYLAKYCAKTIDGEVPRGMRIHGAGGLEYAIKRHICARRAPAWLKPYLGSLGCVRKARGWWQDIETGLAFRSPWVLDGLVYDGFGWSAQLHFVGVTEDRIFGPGMGEEPWKIDRQ